MSTTTELRWFYHGSLPATVMEWFEQETLGPYVGNWDTREDWYLRVSACNYLNIKLRTGKLEVKLRYGNPDVQRFGDRWMGQVEQWVKWGCDHPTNQDSTPNWDELDGVWVSVEKQRSQRRYQLGSAQLPTSVPLEKQISNGCSVEITRLRVNKQDWWSLAFEAFGERSQQQETLLGIANWCSQTSGSPVLSVEQSYAYPQWLMSIGY